jgi:hypothetical protein
MGRHVLAGSLMALLMVLSAGPAQAKGEHGEKVLGLVVVTGPGLDEPIEISGEMTVFEELPTGAAGELSTFLTAAGIFADPDAGWYELPPDISSIGPRYEVRYWVAGDGWESTYVQEMYPYASERPLFRIPPLTAEKLLGRSVELWWSGSPAIISLLRVRGLPSTAPAIALPPAAPVPAALPSPEPSRAWMFLWAAAALMALLLGGAVAGRRRRVITS